MPGEQSAPRAAFSPSDAWDHPAAFAGTARGCGGGAPGRPSGSRRSSYGVIVIGRRGDVVVATAAEPGTGRRIRPEPCRDLQVAPADRRVRAAAGTRGAGLSLLRAVARVEVCAVAAVGARALACGAGAGGLSFRGHLAAEEGALFLRAFEAAWDAVREQRDGDDDSRAHGGSAEPPCAAPTEVSPVDALVEMADVRKTRSVPPALRRALRARDGGCRFPGCGNHRFTDAHHIEHWADGGETSLGNLIQLCRRHHRLLHEGGFSLELRQDGSPVFRRPDGRRIAAVPLLGAVPRNRRRGAAHLAGR